MHPRNLFTVNCDRESAKCKRKFTGPTILLCDTVFAFWHLMINGWNEPSPLSSIDKATADTNEEWVQKLISYNECDSLSWRNFMKNEILLVLHLRSFSWMMMNGLNKFISSFCCICWSIMTCIAAELRCIFQELLFESDFRLINGDTYRIRSILVYKNMVFICNY